MSDGAKTGTPLWVPMREKLDDLLRDETSNTYVCGRVWHAWSVGTMSEDDFTKFDSGDRIEKMVYEIEAICEERIKEEKASLADTLTEALKVAGEALERAVRFIEPMTDRDYELPSAYHMDGYLVVQGIYDELKSSAAALERIRNNKH